MGEMKMDNFTISNFKILAPRFPFRVDSSRRIIIDEEAYISLLFSYPRIEIRLFVTKNNADSRNFFNPPFNPPPSFGHIEEKYLNQSASGSQLLELSKAEPRLRNLKKKRKKGKRNK